MTLPKPKPLLFKDLIPKNQKIRQHTWVHELGHAAGAIISGQRPKFIQVTNKGLNGICELDGFAKPFTIGGAYLTVINFFEPTYYEIFEFQKSRIDLKNKYKKDKCSIFLESRVRAINLES
jgi:hypothetical protein